MTSIRRKRVNIPGHIEVKIYHNIDFRGHFEYRHLVELAHTFQKITPAKISFFGPISKNPHSNLTPEKLVTNSVGGSSTISGNSRKSD